jgi:ketosteroid isomerase-like protein
MRQATDEFARELIDAHHEAWSRGDIPAMLANCHDDVELVLNTGGPEGGPLRLLGKAELKAFLEAAASAVTSRTQVIQFSFKDGIARTTVDTHVCHRATGHTLQGSYRQVIQFDGLKILSSHEFHDAALMQAFWAMVQSDEANDTSPDASDDITGNQS